MNDYWIGNWATSPDQHTKFPMYCGLYFCFTVMTSLFVYMRTGTMQLFSWYATRKLHKDMIRKVLNAPINLYYDVTPIGRILNKFSKDLAVIETNLSYLLGTLLSLFY